MQNMIAVITGASRGIGRAIAITLAKQGFLVVINYNESQLEALETLNEVKKYSDGIVIQADVSNISEVNRMAGEIAKQYGKINVLVNNAGSIIRPGDWENISDEQWDLTYNINAKGTYNCIRALKKLFDEDSVGHIVNISSTVGENGAAAVVAYGAAKAAVINMTMSFAKEFAPKIVVNTVAPGNIDTEMTKSAGKEVVDWIINVTPMKRLGNTDEVADLVGFLCSQKTNFITGQVINVDGGYSLGN